MNQIRSKTLRDAFTLIEIMIAIAIIAILTAVIAPNFVGYMKKSRISSTESTIRMLEGAINMFNAHTGQYPGRLVELIKKPADEKLARKWDGPYIKQKEIPEDPWGNKYIYKLTPQGTDHKYELYSHGPNGKGAPKEEIISVWNL